MTKSALHKYVSCAKNLKIFFKKMQLGFNNNILHNGKEYHVQTEDGGKKNPVVATTIFKEGGIIASKKTNYGMILKSEKLDTVVKEIMRKQHSAVIKDLEKGFFDEGSRTPSEEKKKTPTGGKSEDTPLSSEGEKGIDDIILEYLSIGDKKK